MTDALKHSPLTDWHTACNARFTPFAGWQMPLQYTGAGILAEHHHTRKSASLFDVSHMSQIRLTGSDQHANVARLLPIATDKLKINRNKYCCLSNTAGGVIDDLVAGKDERSYYIVSNAARAAEVHNHCRAALQGDCKLEVIEDSALLAVQGPRAAEVVGSIFPAATELYFMDSAWLSYHDCMCRICRCGYTGEDGFEISVPNTHAVKLAEQLCVDGICQPAGLGARDSLRLEAGLSLYGQELTTESSLVEAGLGFSVSPSRRNTGGFIGAEVILRQIKEGVDRYLVGLVVQGKQALRAGIALSDNSKKAGVITSGTHSPTLGHPIALAMVAKQFNTPGTQLTATLRNREIPAKVTPLPFVAHNYHQRPRNK